MIPVTPSLALEDWEVVETFKRASGPGGQNVNKVATAVQLRFHAMNSPSLSNAVKVRLVQLAGRRMTKDGEILIDAHRFRTQERNREDARERLVELIVRAATPPKKRTATRVPRSQKKRRVEDKRRRSETKAGRGRQRLSDN